MSLSVSVLVGVVLFAWTMWAVLFWGSIAVIERHNPYNKFKWALLWSAAELIVSVAIGNLGFGGLGLLLAWFGFLMRLLLNSYELGLLHAIGVVIVTVVGPYFVFDAFDAVLTFVGTSETMLLLLLYGVPAVVLAVWLWPRRAPAQPTNLPSARIERLGRKRPSAKAPVATATPAPAPSPATSDLPAPAAPPATSALFAPAPAPAASPSLSSSPAASPATSALPPPVAASAASPSPASPASPAFRAALPISPPAPEPPRADGEPSFLR